MGPHCSPIGLGTLGTAAVHRSWSDAEEALLEEGMRAWGRDFRQVRLPRAPPPAQHRSLPFICARRVPVWGQVRRYEQVR